ncbi:MAG: hypothetical protein COS73_03200 [Nitrospirae bacterium CG06_land_8_20_14_3_00_70_43]|nr:MAG: hypothetical protein COS73_03200 [Nitrospirae bacterium CG06_land_8_20_14_3_00_70_43]
MKLAVLLSALLTLLAPPARSMSVVDSKHNLSVSGPGPYKSLVEEEVCVFCHTPHESSGVGVLWNRNESVASYITYTSSTLQNAPGQPTGSSKLCLSCHDGTIALGEVRSRPAPIAFPTGLENLNAGPAFLDTDLQDDHPVSMAYPTTLPGYVQAALLDLPLDPAGLVQCTSCHDPHDDAAGHFLRKPNLASALCTTCHDPVGWLAAAHATSQEVWDSTPPDPWPNSTETTVAANACENCHSPHNAGSSRRLLRSDTEEDNCLVCHNGHVSFKSVAADQQKPYRHPVETTLGVHDPTEDSATMARHVECVDCHNPHAANATTAQVPAASGALAGVSGITDLGTPATPATNQYEVCFKCHGDTANGAAAISRQLLQTNTRLEFDRNNPSFHPVEWPGTNLNVPSLLSPWNTSSLVYCTDCHASDSGPGNGGAGPAGPHGSIYPFLLEREYVVADGTAESATAYALCYKCHDRTSILANQSFPTHALHLGVTVNAPCSVCHDAHGISATQGDAAHNSHLINFDTAIVTPYLGTLAFQDNGTFAGQCTLSCHGKDHLPSVYPEP